MLPTMAFQHPTRDSSNGFSNPSSHLLFPEQGQLSAITSVDIRFQVCQQNFKGFSGFCLRPRWSLHAEVFNVLD